MYASVCLLCYVPEYKYTMNTHGFYCIAWNVIECKPPAVAFLVLIVTAAA